MDGSEQCEPAQYEPAQYEPERHGPGGGEVSRRSSSAGTTRDRLPQNDHHVQRTPAGSGPLERSVHGADEAVRHRHRRQQVTAPRGRPDRARREARGAQVMPRKVETPWSSCQSLLTQCRIIVPNGIPDQPETPFWIAWPRSAMRSSGSSIEGGEERDIARVGVDRRAGMATAVSPRTAGSRRVRIARAPSSPNVRVHPFCHAIPPAPNACCAPPSSAENCSTPARTPRTSTHTGRSRRDHLWRPDRLGRQRYS